MRTTPVAFAAPLEGRSSSGFVFGDSRANSTGSKLAGKLPVRSSTARNGSSPGGERSTASTTDFTIARGESTGADVERLPARTFSIESRTAGLRTRPASVPSRPPPRNVSSSRSKDFPSSSTLTGIPDCSKIRSRGAGTDVSSPLSIRGRTPKRLTKAKMANKTTKPTADRFSISRSRVIKSSCPMSASLDSLFPISFSPLLLNCPIHSPLREKPGPNPAGLPRNTTNSPRPQDFGNCLNFEKIRRSFENFLHG